MAQQVKEDCYIATRVVMERADATASEDWKDKDRIAALMPTGDLTARRSLAEEDRLTLLPGRPNTQLRASADKRKLFSQRDQSASRAMRHLLYIPAFFLATCPARLNGNVVRLRNPGTGEEFGWA
ncbi:MAG: hypothetical protein MI924_10215 [Chloroflexales bacterium]|nr:hypothetical protein [Chloroflexales bacterium]